MTSVGDVAARLRASGSVFADEEAALLVGEATTPAELEALVQRRLAGEPLEYVVGWAEFDGLRVKVAPGVFVPRRRTELLVRLAVERLPADGTLVDVGCGSGAVAAALRARLPGATVVATDIDPDAVACARANLPPGDVFLGDLFDALPAELQGRVDVVTANAPYVPTHRVALMPREAREHEHLVALDGGDDGLVVQRPLIAAAPTWLAPGGWLLMETGRDFAERTADLMTTAGLDARIVLDDEVVSTAVAGRLPPR